MRRLPPPRILLEVANEGGIGAEPAESESAGKTCRHDIMQLEGEYNQDIDHKPENSFLE
jgi:hypothetical protein